MSGFDIQQAVPRYLMADRNGKALAKAIEAAMNYCMEKAQEGLDTILDVEKMPEWRLDEMAWETNCLYDDTAEVETKRAWIRNAQTYWMRHGTAEGIRQYIRNYFGEASITEWFDGDDLEPGEFDVTISSAASEEVTKWIYNAVARTKNVRSVLHGIYYNGAIAETAETYEGATVTGTGGRAKTTNGI